MEVWVRAKLLQVHSRVGETDVEFIHADQPFGLCVRTQDVIQHPPSLILGHRSDCALFNGPAMSIGPCNCGALEESE